MAHHRTRSENFHYGRILLVLVFLILRGVDFSMYYFCYEANKRAIITIIISDTLWSVALLTAIWLRQVWARYFLVTLLLICLGLSLICEGYIQAFFADHYAPVMSIYCAGYIAAVLILILSAAIDKLTSRAYG